MTRCQKSGDDRRSAEAREYRELSSAILRLASEGLSRASYMREAGRLLFRCADCDRLEVVLSEEGQLSR